jgi:predicted nucleic acid-binding protein
VDRVLLDANVLFAVAWRKDAALKWLKGIELLSSSYAVEAARRNRDTSAQKGRLTRLLWRVELVEPEHFTLPYGVRLPEKDVRILRMTE